jgi:hypothetical protein
MKNHTLWICPNCGRQFERTHQSHSCTIYPLEQHFIGKPVGEMLYHQLKKELIKHFDLFKIESLECCIHFATDLTFAAAKIFKKKIVVEFALNHKIKSNRITRLVEMSSKRFLHYVDVKKENEIDEELILWIKEAEKSNHEKS